MLRQFLEKNHLKNMLLLFGVNAHRNALTKESKDDKKRLIMTDRGQLFFVSLLIFLYALYICNRPCMMDHA